MPPRPAIESLKVEKTRETDLKTAASSRDPSLFVNLSPINFKLSGSGPGAVTVDRGGVLCASDASEAFVVVF